MRTIERADLHIDKAMVVAVSRSLDERLPAVVGSACASSRRCSPILARRLVRRPGACTTGAAGPGGHAAEAIEHERRLASERVELALRGADLGLWDLHVPSGDFVVNARERALLGFGADDACRRAARGAR